jgi:hypothetical protein
MPLKIHKLNVIFLFRSSDSSFYLYLSVQGSVFRIRLFEMSNMSLKQCVDMNK